jgi:hypothetical protein
VNVGEANRVRACLDMTSYADGESKGERRPGLARFARRESL